MKHLHLFRADQAHHVAYPETVKTITTRDSALEIFTDFQHAPALVIDSTLSPQQAEIQMRTAHVRMKIVVDRDNQVLGIVSLDDLSNQEIIKRISQGYQRSELNVTDFMHPLSSLKAFSWEELQDASIQDVIDTLQNSGQQHCLVLDGEEIPGLISASDIARKLKLPLDIHRESNFSRISHVIYHQIHPHPTVVSNG